MGWNDNSMEEVEGMYFDVVTLHSVVEALILVSSMPVGSEGLMDSRRRDSSGNNTWRVTSAKIIKDI